MSKKPKTPQELADKKPPKKTYSYSLIQANADHLAEIAQKWNLPVSDLVDEAIRHYIEAIIESKKKD